MVTASTSSDNEPAKDLIIVHTVQLKPMIKAQSEVAFASVNSEKTRLKKLMMMMKMIIIIIIIIIIMNKLQETTVFSGHQKLTSATKLRPEK